MCPESAWCLVSIELTSTAAQIDKFTRRMRDLMEVQQCYHVTGSSDIFLVVTAETMEGYRAFVRSQLEIPHVARYETHVVLDLVKVGLSLPTGKDRKDCELECACACRLPAGRFRAIIDSFWSRNWESR
jgi:hypothetical protein